MRRSGPWWLGLVFVLAGAPSAPAQPQTNLAGQIDLPRLVDLAAQRLRVNVEYDASALKGSVTLRLEGTVTDADLWNLLNRVLAERGFTTVRMGEQQYAVVKIADAQALAPLIQSDRMPEGPAPGYLTVVVRASHRNPKEIADAIGKVLSKSSGSAMPVGDGGLILVSDLAPRVNAAIDLARLLDTPAQQSGIEEVPIQNLSAQAIATLIGQVSAKREAGHGREGRRGGAAITQRQRRARGGTPGPHGRLERTHPEPRQA
jgi:type II secretory pathway component GspD/PulD (secretin)